MPAIDGNTAGFTVDEESNILRFVRELGAPPTQVFDAWTDPAQVAVWWDATGERLGACEIDLRPGGRFTFVTRLHPDKPFEGVYVAISRPDKLVFDANGAVGTVSLEARAGGTRMTVEIACQSTEHLRQFVAVGVADGTSRTLDNLMSHMDSVR